MTRKIDIHIIMYIIYVHQLYKIYIQNRLDENE